MATFPTTASGDTGKISTRGNGGFPPGGGNRYSDSGYFETRLRRARLGLVVAIIGIVMIFVSMTSAYIVRKGLPTFDPRTNSLKSDWLFVRLPALVWINTLVLLVSSVTMELARRQAASDLAIEQASSIQPSAKSKDKISWLALTIVLGLSFLAGQLMLWRELAARGFYLASAPGSSFVYLLTGLHGVHLLGGVLALLVVGAASILRHPLASRYVAIDITGWYWHFMAALWLFIFWLLEFVK